MIREFIDRRKPTENPPALAALDALVRERDEYLQMVFADMAAENRERRSYNAQGIRMRAERAEIERDEARRLLREVVKADRQDAQMGYPIPGDSCMGAFIGLVLMRYLAELDDPPPTKEEACTGGGDCPATTHLHGCYRDDGNCDYPDHHDAAPTKEGT